MKVRELLEELGAIDDYCHVRVISKDHYFDKIKVSWHNETCILWVGDFDGSTDQNQS